MLVLEFRYHIINPEFIPVKGLYLDLIFSLVI